MRDKKRIERILNKIKTLWKRNPDLRFYQMLIDFGLMKDDLELWNMEDDKLEVFLDIIFKGAKANENKSKKRSSV